MNPNTSVIYDIFTVNIQSGYYVNLFSILENKNVCLKEEKFNLFLNL